jgi:hypothetical protein
VITEGVVPSFHVDYKRTRLKQCVLLALVPLDVCWTSNGESMDCTSGADCFSRLTQPQVVNHQRVAALRFGDPRVQALLSAIVLFAFVPRGFSHREVRHRLAALLGLDSGALSPGWVTDDLRRPRLHGLIARLPGTQRYQPTEQGLRTPLFCSWVYLQVIRPGLAQVLGPPPPAEPALRPAFDALTAAIDQFLEDAACAA